MLLKIFPLRILILGNRRKCLKKKKISYIAYLQQYNTLIINTFDDNIKIEVQNT